MRRVVPLMLALLLGGCASDTTTPAASQPTASGPGQSSGRAGLVLALAARDQGPVHLFKVDADRRASPLRTLSTPDHYFSAQSVSLAAGPDPAACVVWSADEPEGDGSGAEQLRCYGPGDSVGRIVQTQRDPFDVALRADGDALLWNVEVRGSNYEDSWYELVIADLDGGRATRLRRFAWQSSDVPPGTTPLGCAESVDSVVWADAGRLLLQEWGANDNPGWLYVHAVEPGQGGHDPECHRVPEPGHRGQGGYTYFTRPAWSDGHRFLALEGQYCEIQCLDKKPPLARRAVLVDVRTGRVVDVVAQPAEGRFVELVSGGADGIVYVTDAEGRVSDPRVYVRWPGEKHGKPVSGLPRDAKVMTVQP